MSTATAEPIRPAADPTADPTANPTADQTAGRAVAPPTWQDETAARASQVIGGRWGRHATAGRWWTPVRVLLAFAALTLALAYLEKSPCANGNWVAYKQYTHACYSDIVPLWGAEGLADNQIPYIDHAVEYPVLIGAFMELTSLITHGLLDLVPSSNAVLLFGGINAALLALVGLITVGATAGAAGRRPYDAAILALSPLLVFHAFSNWDLLAMALASGALWAWGRRRPVLAGVLIGLGTAAKLYPALLAVPLVLLAVRTRRWQSTARALIAALVAWLVVNLPIAVLWYHGWSEFYRFSIHRTTEASTVWFMGNYINRSGLGGGYPTPWVPPGSGVAALFLAAMAALAWVALRAPVRPRVGQLAFLAVLGFLLTTKVWSPQYSLWLVPLVALARPRWRLALVWQFTEIGVWILTLLWLFGFSTPDRGLNYGWLMLILLIRDGLLITIATLTIREMWHPERDVVRAAGLDDPAGGDFEGVDAPPVSWLGRRRVTGTGTGTRTAAGGPAVSDGSDGDQRLAQEADVGGLPVGGGLDEDV